MQREEKRVEFVFRNENFETKRNNLHVPVGLGLVGRGRIEKGQRCDCLLVQCHAECRRKCESKWTHDDQSKSD